MKTGWVQRRTLKVGTCANAPVWWNERDGTVHILVGNDDEAWDMCVTIPLGTLHEILGEVGEPPRFAPPPPAPRSLIEQELKLFRRRHRRESAIALYYSPHCLGHLRIG